MDPLDEFFTHVQAMPKQDAGALKAPDSLDMLFQPPEGAAGAPRALRPGLIAVASGDRTHVKGNTFNVKDALKAAGFRWDPDAKAWWAPTAQFEAYWGKVPG